MIQSSLYSYHLFLPDNKEVIHYAQSLVFSISIKVNKLTLILEI